MLIGWSDDGGSSWSEPVNVEQFALDRKTGWTLQLASDGKRLAMCQEVWDEAEGGRSEIWLAFSHDGGQTWSERAVYSTGSLLDPAIAFAPDGSLIMAGSSRSEDGSRPWVVHSHIAM